MSDLRLLNKLRWWLVMRLVGDRCFVANAHIDEHGIRPRVERSTTSAHGWVK